MNRIKVLDCTLRDGGYVNNWEFGKNNIINIINKLSDSGLEIVECGFLTNRVKEDKDSTQFSTIGIISDVLPKQKTNTEYVCMINYGEYNIEDLPDYDGKSITGIRVAFHKKDLNGALELCNGIVKKGYKLFIQPMVSVAYSDVEFIELIKRSNEIFPYAFYIVDSFGVMKRSDLMRFFYLVDNNLNRDIYVGYHSHNNIQLSYSNAQDLVDLKTKRKLIIDSSVFGMGRGAGNLNTELFVEYLNDVNGADYKTKPLLQIIDEVLNNIYISNYWGYSLPHYISAKHNCHPNYATHLSAKDTLTAEDISNILMMLDESQKVNFDAEYVEKLYLKYQSHKIDDLDNINKLKDIFRGKNVIAIAPGMSINNSVKAIEELSKQPNTLTVSVNFNPQKIKVDYVFISNLRRYDQLEIENDMNLVVTSNVTEASDATFRVNYIDLLIENSAVSDNAGLMLIKLLSRLEVRSIMLAGYDGYSYDAYKNYVEKDLTLIKKKTIVDTLNEGMKKSLNDFAKYNDIQFITSTRYLNLEES
ncbi:MAG: 3-hydroxy-3-methylglutaryl-CoA lyase [Clostridiaceae bacterium]|nr:3-hydroxy-3-methylglutaryl-CoA lyase [Clostridiaceae bacterium]